MFKFIKYYCLKRRQIRAFKKLLKKHGLDKNYAQNFKENGFSFLKRNSCTTLQDLYYETNASRWGNCYPWAIPDIDKHANMYKEWKEICAKRRWN